jgi:calcineurin-like phosphoesterase family protein
VSSSFFISDTHFGHENIMKYCRRVKFITAEEVELLDAADRGEIDQRKVRISPESIERMNTAMIDNINAVVGENDVLYHIGDAFWGHDFDFAKAMRDRIKCRTIHHIWGNHDEPEVAGLFASSEKYAEVVVEKQKIFMCHYPMRAWNKSHKGSWCLYGHVHGKTWDEDKYGLAKDDRAYLQSKFASTIADYAKRYGMVCGDGEATEIAGLLAQDVADWNCNMLTLDVGVDTHDYRPWSMDELRAELFPKMEKARLRREREKASYPLGSRK